MGIWGDRRLPIIGVSGAHSSGKTYFACSVDPKNTLVLDLEAGAGDYQEMGFDYRDMRSLTASRCKGLPRPIDVFQTVLDTVQAIPTGKYSAIVFDPFSGTNETGLADHIAEKYETYGFKTRKTFEDAGGLYWSAVKSYEEEVLLHLREKCESFIFIAHQRNKWIGNAPTREIESAGKKTLFQLANMYLTLERKSAKRGEAPPRIPAAVVDKVKILTSFPPRLPRCTPDDIRFYLQNPSDYANLAPDEIASENVLSDDEKLQLATEGDLARATAATAELETAKLQEKILSARDIAMQRARKQHETQTASG